MAELNDFIKQYDFICKKCKTELTPYHARETALLYGIALLVGEKDGFVGWSCPSCNALTTNLTKVDEDPYHFINLTPKRFPVHGQDYLEDVFKLQYQSFPLSFSSFQGTFDFTDSILFSGHNVLHLPKKYNLTNGKYLSFKSGTHAFGPLVKIITYDISEINSLLKDENEKQVKVFPRYQICELLQPSIIYFCWNNRLKFGSNDGINHLNVNDIQTSPEELNIKKSFEFLQILESYNNFDISRAFEQLYPLAFIKCFLEADHKKINFRYSDFSEKIWSSYSTIWMREILNDLGEEFISDYLFVTSKINHCRELEFDLVKSYINKLYETITSKYKRSIVRKETKIISKKRVEEAEKSFSNVCIISEDKSIDDIKIHISRLAPLKLADSFLILGERGSGKDLFARAIHEASNRKGKLVKVDCGAIPEKLFESEVFGYTKGAFTGALNNTPGKLCAAAGGTIFFDEIGNLPLSLQPKLLRALQDRQYVPVGSNQPRPIDAKFVFATNKQLEKMVDAELFMPDLYDRFKHPQLTIPPLRERKHDVRLLAAYFIQKYDSAENENKDLKPISMDKECTETLMGYNWPGNIRELEQVIKEIILKRHAEKDRTEISKPELPDDFFTKGKSSHMPTLKSKKKLLGNTKIENDDIIQLMKEHGNNKTRVAEQLGVVRKTIWLRCKKLGL
jgi:DNA-binding NtrC family response regulator